MTPAARIVGDAFRITQSQCILESLTAMTLYYKTTYYVYRYESHRNEQKPTSHKLFHGYFIGTQQHLAHGATRALRSSQNVHCNHSCTAPRSYRHTSLCCFCVITSFYTITVSPKAISLNGMKITRTTLMRCFGPPQEHVH